MLKKLFGSKSFYKTVFKVTLPIMLQQVLISIVGLADNLMVGQLSEDTISGIYIASKILFVVNLVIFGAVEGASIFFAQFYGSKDEKHIKQCFNFKIYADLIVTFICFMILLLFSSPLANLFVNEVQADIASSYLKIYLICLVPFAFSYIFGTSYREINKSFVPMIGSIIALFVNIALNYLLIFEHNGHFGYGAKGAAIATVIARFIEFLFIFIYSLVTKPVFLHNIFKNYKIDIKLSKDIFIKSLPLLFNELFWSVGQIMLIFAYSKVSDIAAPTLSISQTLFDLFYIANIALGNGIAVIMGNTLGANNIDEAKKQINYFLTLTIIISLVMGVLLFSVGPFITSLYKVSDQAKDLAKIMIMFNALLLPLLSINCSIFFMIRSGGFTLVVLAFDSLFSWAIQVPLALLLAYKSNLPLQTQFLLVNLSEIIKLIVGSILLKSYVWIKNLTTTIGNNI